MTKRILRSLYRICCKPPQPAPQNRASAPMNAPVSGQAVGDSEWPSLTFDALPPAVQQQYARLAHDVNEQCKREEQR